MTAVQAGDRPALGRLVERHHRPLIGYLYRLSGGDRPLAEDLAQETFVRLLRGSCYQVGRPFKPWLYAIATNLARDHFKAAYTRHTVAPVETADPVDAAPGPEEVALAAEQGGEVAVALRRLGPEYRAALLLRFYGDLSLQEIAIALDVPLGTVKSRLSVGCRRLRVLLANPERSAPC